MQATTRSGTAAGAGPEHWLVLGHEATRSGAPRMLLRVLEAARQARGADWSCEIVLRDGGPLLAEFAAFGPVRVLGHPLAEGRTLRARLLRRAVMRPWLQPWRFQRWLAQSGTRHFDLVYNNTATNGEFLPGLRRLGCPIVTHVHELGTCMRRFNTPAALAATLERSARFVAVAPAVADDLVTLGAAPERISVVPNFLPALPAQAGAKERAAARSRLGLAAETAVVVGCGHLDLVKGPDLFLDLVAQIRSAVGPRACGCWLGGTSDVGLARRLAQAVRRRGLAAAVRFVGYVEDPSAWYAASDVVAVTSRAESFSLVALDAAAMGRPVVGFAGARGLEALLGGADDLLAPGHDVAALAERATRLLRDAAEAERIGERLRAGVAQAFLAEQRAGEILAATAAARAWAGQR